MLEPSSDRIGDRIAVPPMAEAAFFLDFDGTLVDIAPTPDSVQVAEGLPKTLIALRALLGDALAVVTGRTIEQIDHFLPHIPYAVAGEHGAAFRYFPDDQIHRSILPHYPPSWLEEAEKLAQNHPGVLIEKKNNGFVFHYRKAPELEKMLHDFAEKQVSAKAGEFEIHSAKMAWEIRPKGIDKGQAVSTLMGHAPFKGRKPVFIGDDVTDEDGIRVARAMGGVGYRIPDNFSNPHHVRLWLNALVEGNGK